MMKKAVQYIDNQQKRIQSVEMDDDGIGYYVLSLSMQKEYPKLTQRLIEMYENAFAGSKDRRLRIEGARSPVSRHARVMCVV